VRSSAGAAVLAIATAVVVASIIAAVIMVGGPESGRLERLDESRVDDLQSVMKAIDRFWTDRERLPASLQELGEDPRVRIDFLDPGSGEPYEYRGLKGRTYELCAVFDQESRTPLRAPTDFWSHGVGRRCFELTARSSEGSPESTTSESRVPSPGQHMSPEEVGG
jgi:hypothetical protein